MKARLFIALFVASFLTGFPLEGLAAWLGCDMITIGHGLRLDRLRAS